MGDAFSERIAFFVSALWISHRPSMPTIHEVLQQGWRLHQAGQIDQAEQHYRHVLASAPKNEDALVYFFFIICH